MAPKKLHLTLITAGLIFLWSYSLYASTNRLSFLFFRPATGTMDLLSTLSPTDLKDGQWRFSTHLGYINRPLETTRNSTTRLNPVVDHLIVQHFGMAHAFTDGWEMEMDIPLAWGSKFATPVETADIQPTSFKTDLGDLQLRHRFAFFDVYKNGIGLGLIPFVTLPTGNENHFVADKLPTGGVLFAVNARLAEKLIAQLNIGGEARQRFILFDLDLGSRLIFSGGLNFLLTDHWKGKIDFYSATPLNDLYKLQKNSPTEMLFGSDVQLGKSPFNLFLGGGFSLVNAVGSPRFRSILGISYISEEFPLTKLAGVTKSFKEIPKTRSTDLLEMETGLTIYFVGETTITEESHKVLDRVVLLLKQHPEVRMVFIRGHASGQKNTLSSMAISLKRAKVVDQYLRSKEVNPSLLKIEGYGNIEPLEKTRPEQNNRVVIQVEN